MTERRNTKNSMKNGNYCDCNRKNAIKFGGFKNLLYFCSMKKPSDFWLRKGKVVGETKPTEKSREEPKKSTIRTLLFYSIIYAVYRTWFIYHLFIHKSPIYNLKSPMRLLPPNPVAPQDFTIPSRRLPAVPQAKRFPHRSLFLTASTRLLLNNTLAI